MATNFLGLDLPTVSVTIGPTWANKINTALETIDYHDHSSGKGAKVPSSGLNINADIDFDSNKPYNLLSTKFASNSATLTGSDNVNSVYVKLGDLYYTNSAGTAVQITSGTSLLASPGAVQTVDVQGVAADLTIPPSAVYVYLTVDTTAARQITLPLASSTAEGRLYIIKDISGTANTNNITVVTQGSETLDGAASAVLNSDYGSWWIVGDGSSAWYIS